MVEGFSSRRNISHCGAIYHIEDISQIPQGIYIAVNLPYHLTESLYCVGVIRAILVNILEKYVGELKPKRSDI